MFQHHLPLFLIVCGAAVIPFFARKLRVPSAALEIIYGMLLFNFALEGHPEWFQLLRELGLIYLMFVAGMELDLRSLLNSGRIFWYLLISLISFSITPLIFVFLGFPFYLGVTVAMVSAGIIVPVLKETGLIKKPLGQKIIGVGLTGELLSILVLTLIDAFNKHGATTATLIELFKLVLLFGLALVVLKGLYLLAWWNPERVQRVMESEDPVEEGVRTVVTVVFAGGMLAMLAGAEAILGSFLIGVVFTSVFHNKGRFEEKINAIGFGFLIPFFFIGVGSDLDVQLLTSWSVVLFSLFLTLMVMASNMTPVFLTRPLGMTLKEGWAMTILLSAPLSMIVVAGTLGERMGLLTQEIRDPLILTALFSSILYPSLFRSLARTVVETRTDSI